ncbi:hypothetical protein HHK36_026816 [Tetracentron sinense]|uniref:SWI/SNF-like complex subunit BAF250 C-terminal domain-containing protein n=1 Tax=Tetracentron sinense TaxID=13715 RepID=A0A834YHJ8_TETSI|nr:hypothetical protein HHK36_026816 [Tetracentron sinense]
MHLGVSLHSTKMDHGAETKRVWESAKSRATLLTVRVFSLWPCTRAEGWPTLSNAKGFLLSVGSPMNSEAGFQVAIGCYEEDSIEKVVDNLLDMLENDSRCTPSVNNEVVADAVISGSLSAVRGSLVQLGDSFSMEEGTTNHNSACLGFHVDDLASDSLHTPWGHQPTSSLLLHLPLALWRIRSVESLGRGRLLSVQVDDWCDIALPKELTKAPRVRLLGVNSVVSGFGNEFEALGSNDALPHSGLGSGLSKTEVLVQKSMTKHRPSEWWFDEDGLFNLDEEGRVEKQQCAVAASNIIRNFSFMPDNEVIMAQHRHCLETVFQCIEDHNTEDEELVTNALETIVNLAPLLDLRIFSSSKPSYIKITEKRAVQAIMGMLGSSVKAWHCAAAELLGRLIINPDNEPFLLPFAPQIYKRLVDLLSLLAVDAQAAAVGALYNLAEVNMDCRLKLASERWAIDRLLKVIRTPHPVPEVCRKAAMIMESLVSEPQNKALLLAYENVFAEILFSDGRHSDTFARILYELTSRPNNKVATARGVWGM